MAAIAAILGAGVAVALAEDVPLPRPRPPMWVEPQSFRAAAGPDFNSAEVTSAPTPCDYQLAKIALIEPVPRLIGPGACGGRDMVQLDVVWLADGAHVDIKPAPVLTCEMAATFAGWLREDVAPRLTALASELHSVENYDDFECRSRNRVIGAKPSNHGNGIAVDVRSFTLADGRRIELTDVTADKPLRQALHNSACARFSTVLGPGARLSRRPYPSRHRAALTRLPHLRVGRARAAADRHRQRADRRQAGSAAAAASGRGTLSIPANSARGTMSPPWLRS